LSKHPALTDSAKLELQRERLKLLEADKTHRLNLPHKYGWANYGWYNDFFETNNRTVLLCAANQISKSSSQIRKVISLATERELWSKYFRQRPKLFWYLYPTATMATTEYRTKWEPDFLPKGAYKDHPVYGWKPEYRNRGDIFALHFNTGVSIYFKTYEQDQTALQASSVDYVACFTASMPVLTDRGVVAISDVVVGDKVFTKEKEFQVVTALKTRVVDRVIKRITSHGESIEATPDHNIWVKNKWVEFETLTELETLGTDALWLKKKSLSIVERITSDTRTANTSNTDTLEVMEVLKNIFTLKFGKTKAEKYLMVSLFTTWMRILATIRLLTWPAYRRLSTLDNIRLKSGLMELLESLNQKFVNIVGLNLKQEQLKSLPQRRVLKDVGDYLVEQAKCVSLAIRFLLSREMKREESFVLDGALELRGKQVYCLTVNPSHNFQVCGIIAKNCDEELPENLWDEVNFRRNATDGIFSMVFTATLGQEFWRKAIEPKQNESESMPDAWKRQVSMFDCQYYADGTPSIWTTEKIHRTIAMCRSEAEVQRRVYGKFVKDSGLKYQSFSRGVNVVEAYDIPPSWIHYAGVDLGAGGDDNHPSAITLLAVHPNYQKGCVYKSWRGDKEQTTMPDVANKYLELVGHQPMAASFYDYASKEFKLVTDRMGMSFLPADKGRETGEQVMNALFKNRMLDIFNIPDNEPLISEIMTLAIGIDKRKAKDDSVDSCRYAVTRIPWDWSIAERRVNLVETVEKKRLTPHEIAAVERNRDRDRMVANNFQDDIDLGIDREVEEWADYLDQSF